MSGNTHLKSNIDVSEFLKSVRQCQGEVEFHTSEGDILNLKSTLSKYLFIAVSTDPGIFDNGVICCQKDSDYTIIERFLL